MESSVCETRAQTPVQNKTSGASPNEASFSTTDSSGACRSPPLDSPSGVSEAEPSDKNAANANSPTLIRSSAEGSPGDFSNAGSPEDIGRCSDEFSDRKMHEISESRGEHTMRIQAMPTPCRRRVPPTSSSNVVHRGDDLGEADPRAQLHRSNACEDSFSCDIEGLEKPFWLETQDIRPDPLRSKHSHPLVSLSGPSFRLGQSEQTANCTNLRTHITSLEDPVGGTPALQGDLLIFDSRWGTLKPWSILLFANGFYAVSRNGSVHSFAWSPFSVIDLDEIPGLAGFLGFSLSILDQATGFIFAFGREAQSTRRKWIDVMASTLRKYTKSFFPACTLAVEPLKDKPSTARRIVAGYLLVSGDTNGSVCVPYCELQAHEKGEGLLVMYDSDQCDTRIMSLTITGNTFLHAKQGIDCSLFTVGHLRFCARTVEERNLWHRAISNVQVKSCNGAPDPTQEDLQNFREAVMERVRMLEFYEGAGRIGVAGGTGPSLPEVAPKLPRLPVGPLPVAQPPKPSVVSPQPSSTLAPTPSKPPTQAISPELALRGPDACQPVAGQQQLLSPFSQAAVQERGGACQQDAKLLQPRSTNSSVSSKSPSSFLKVSGPLQDRPDPCFLLAPMTPEATGDIDMALMDIQDDTELGALMAEPQDADLGDLDALPTVPTRQDSPEADALHRAEHMALTRMTQGHLSI